MVQKWYIYHKKKHWIKQQIKSRLKALWWHRNLYSQLKLIGGPFLHTHIESWRYSVNFALVLFKSTLNQCLFVCLFAVFSFVLFFVFFFSKSRYVFLVLLLCHMIMHNIIYIIYIYIYPSVEKMLPSRTIYWNTHSKRAILELRCAVLMFWYANYFLLACNFAVKYFIRVQLGSSTHLHYTGSFCSNCCIIHFFL